jgi:hypothetical protein
VWKEPILVQFEIQYQSLPGRTEVNHEDESLSVGRDLNPNAKQICHSLSRSVGSSWETCGSSDNQEIPSLRRNGEVHYLTKVLNIFIISSASTQTALRFSDWLSRAFTLISYWGFFFILKMEAIRSSETLVSFSGLRSVSAFVLWGNNQLADMSRKYCSPFRESHHFIFGSSFEPHWSLHIHRTPTYDGWTLKYWIYIES